MALVNNRSEDQDGLEQPKSVPLLMQLVTGCYNDIRAKPSITHEKGVGSPCGKCKQCSGLDLHFWRKTCKNCGCKYEDHKININDSFHDAIVYNLFRMKDDDIVEINTDDNNNLLNHPYVKEFTINHASKYQSMQISIDGKKVSSRKRSGGSNEDEEKRHQQLLKQIPPQDFEPTYCHDLSADEKEEFKLYIKLIQTNAIGKGYTRLYNENNPTKCTECKEVISNGVKYIGADRLPDKYWHHQCFKCTTCNEQLIDEVYFKFNESVYCGRHFGELYKQRCASCDELIFSMEYTSAEQREWHEKHFCCFKCDAQLCNIEYICHNNQPVCLECYNDNFPTICDSCNEIIPNGTTRLNYEEKNYHISSVCFKCFRCGKSMVNGEFIGNNGDVFCSFQCAE